MGMIKFVKNYISLKRQLDRGIPKVPSVYSLDNKDYAHNTNDAVSLSKANWPELLSEYITNAIVYYAKWLKGTPQKVRLVFHYLNFQEELEPKIYLDYSMKTILLDYENLRYGKLLKHNRDAQRQCVCAAENDYLGFREAITNRKELLQMLQETSQIVSKRLNIPVEFCML